MCAKKPDSALTATQHEILEIVWARPQGATVTEIWEASGPSRRDANHDPEPCRPVGKTPLAQTQQIGRGFRYTAAVDRETTARMLANEFVDGFFGGSASSLVMSLLGNKRVSPSELENLRRLLDAPTAKNDVPKDNS